MKLSEHLLPRSLWPAVLAVAGLVCWAFRDAADPGRATQHPAAASPANVRPTASPPGLPAGISLGRIEQEGISVNVSVQHLVPATADDSTFHEGDDVVFRFAIADTATGAAVPNLYPAAWLDRESETDAATHTCEQKARAHVSGGLLSQAELDLTTYYVLALNHDGTISVVDPQFGFGGSRLLALVPLNGVGEDWALTADGNRLFVSLPDAHQVAVVDTTSWRVVAHVDIPYHPTRVALQPDGQYLWVAHDGSAENPRDGGLTVLAVENLEVAARIPCGERIRDVAFSEDSRFAFVVDTAGGGVSVVDVRSLTRIRELNTGPQPISLACSSRAGMVYVADRVAGTITAVDAARQDVVAVITAEPGIEQIRFAPGGRFAFAVNAPHDCVHIVDAASNRVVQTADLEDEPFQVAFSDGLAYLSHRRSADVLMIPLEQIGTPGRRVPVVGFPGGQAPPGEGTGPGLAPVIVQTPGANAVLVANPKDRAVYFYKEGMAAPMGNFSNDGREPRAVQVVDRSLRERTVGGVYETTARLPRAGRYDVVFFLDAPRIAHCFKLEIAAARDGVRSASSTGVQPLARRIIASVGQLVPCQFRLVDPVTGQPRVGADDAVVLVYRAPGSWHERLPAVETSAGLYTIDFAPPAAGTYYASLECASLGITVNNPDYLILDAVEALPSRQPTLPAQDPP